MVVHSESRTICNEQVIQASVVFQLLKVGQQQRIWYGVTQELELLLYSSNVKSIVHLDQVFARLNGQLLVD